MRGEGAIANFPRHRRIQEVADGDVERGGIVSRQDRSGDVEARDVEQREDAGRVQVARVSRVHRVWRVQQEHRAQQVPHYWPAQQVRRSPAAPRRRWIAGAGTGALRRTCSRSSQGR